MKIAVIKAGGKQYFVEENKKIQIDPLKNIDDTHNILFPNILLYADDQKFFLGKPYLDNVKVVGELIKEKKKKISILKYRPKTRYRKKKGYKVVSWLVNIKEINIK